MTEAYERLAHVLGDPSLPMEKRQRAAQLLGRSDKEVLPVLIVHLKDGRTHQGDYRDISETSDRDRIVPSRSLTVGEKCESLLYEIVFGTVRLPIEARVGDWNRWWAINRGKPFQEIVADARKMRIQYERR
ncbi:MAG TPA: hypothetical protein VJB14_13615 [Planctomycetota bacterium]|nr:hypothetical protein [Planctomycetota bacterium]